MDKVLKDCNGVVAVVGNGPLTSDDRDAINSHACVVRFNDMKNKTFEDKTTLHVIRSSLGKFPGLSTRDPEVPILPILAPDSHPEALLDNVANVLPPLTLEKGESLFPSCDSCESKYECVYTSSNKGPSSGGIVLSKLNESPMVHTIDVYGMNWNNSIRHIDFLYPNLVPECCDKCIIHETHSNNYDPRHTMNIVSDYANRLANLTMCKLNDTC